MDSATKKIEVKDNDIKEPQIQPVKVDPNLQNKLVKAFQAGKYLICITRLEGDRLSHNTFTKDFKKGDIAPTLDQWANELAKEME